MQDSKQEELCPFCDGNGYTSEHSTQIGAHAGDGECLGYCPVQVQCEKCNGTGKILSTPLPSSAELVRQIRDKIGRGMDSRNLLYGYRLTDSEAAALIDQCRTEGICEWKESGEEGTWRGGCGILWRLEAEGPKENGMNFCPRCGKKLIIITNGYTVEKE